MASVVGLVVDKSDETLGAGREISPRQVALLCPAPGKMQRCYQIIFLAGLLVCGGTASPTVIHAAPAAGRPETYINKVYSFKSEVPATIAFSRTHPPSPDHGIGIDLDAKTHLWVTADYTESTLPEVESDRQTAGCRVARRGSTRLGGKPARQMWFSCPASSGEKAYRERLVLAVVRWPGRAPICFQIGVRASGANVSRKADVLFDRLVAGFRILK